MFKHAALIAFLTTSPLAAAEDAKIRDACVKEVDKWSKEDLSGLLRSGCELVAPGNPAACASILGSPEQTKALIEVLINDCVNFYKIYGGDE